MLDFAPYDLVVSGNNVDLVPSGSDYGHVPKENKMNDNNPG